MPIEIFISYRRSDTGGHARYLGKELLQWFDEPHVFFDLASMDLGDVFTQKIDTAVRECSVMLALIGPGWATVEQAGKRRLHDPTDVVRNEIALALQLGKQVVPVLLDSATMPSAADLPDVLAPLALRNAHTQGGRSFEYDEDLQRLGLHLAGIAGVSAPRVRSARQPQGLVAGRDKLPVLCDRSLQDDAAAKTIRAELRSERRRPIVLVLHGRTDEAHHAFVDRLESYSLPRLLKGTVVTPGDRFVRVNDLLPLDGGQGAFDRRLRERIGEALETGLVDDDLALLRQMQQLKLSSLLAVVTWRASEVGGDAMLLLQRVFDYWAQFPAVSTRTLVGCIVCLKYDHPSAGRGWMKRLFGGGDPAEVLRAAIERSVTGFGLDPRVAWCVARELPSVTVADLDRWVLEVARLIGRFSVGEERLQAIIGGAARPMEGVLAELEKLVPQT